MHAIVFVVAGRCDGDDDGGRDAEAELRREGCGKNPAASDAPAVVETAKDEGTETEAEDRGRRSWKPAHAGRVFVGGNAKADVYSISYVHGEWLESAKWKTSRLKKASSIGFGVRMVMGSSVTPVCMETNEPHFEIEALSSSPVIK